MTYNEILGGFKKYMPEGVQDKVIVPIPVEDENPEPQENVIELEDVTLTYSEGYFYSQNCKILKTEYPYEQYNTTSSGDIFRVDGVGEYEYVTHGMGCELNTDLEEYQDYCHFDIRFEVYDQAEVPVGEHIVQIKCEMYPAMPDSDRVEVIVQGIFNFPEIQ